MAMNKAKLMANYGKEVRELSDKLEALANVIDRQDEIIEKLEEHVKKKKGQSLQDRD